jgi:cyanate permease
MSDPVRAKRAQAARLAEVGQRVGYLLLGVAVVAFVVGAVRGFNSVTTALVTASLLATTVVLAPAIVLGYAVKAAEREDREQGR